MPNCLECFQHFSKFKVRNTLAQSCPTALHYCTQIYDHPFPQIQTFTAVCLSGFMRFRVVCEMPGRQILNVWTSATYAGQYHCNPDMKPKDKTTHPHTPTPTHTDTKQHCQQSVCPPFPVCKKKGKFNFSLLHHIIAKTCVTYTPWVLTEFTIWPTSTTDKWKVFRYADCIMLWACSGELPFTIRTCWYI